MIRRCNAGWRDPSLNQNGGEPIIQYCERVYQTSCITSCGSSGRIGTGLVEQVKDADGDLEEKFQGIVRNESGCLPERLMKIGSLAARELRPPSMMDLGSVQTRHFAVHPRW